MKFHLIPHIGAGNIKLGMGRIEIQSILGIPNFSTEKSTMNFGDIIIPVPAKDGFFNNELQVTYDEDKKVDFIEFSAKDSKTIQVLIEGINIFRTPASLLLQGVSKKIGSDYGKEGEEIPFSYTFPSLDLALWRPVVPELDENEVELPETEEGKYFWTVGIGVKGYFSK